MSAAVMISELALQLAVQNLLARYAEAIDEDRLETWPDFFSDSCCYRIVSVDNHERGLPIALIHADSRGMLEDRVAALRKACVYEDQRYRHVLGCSLVKRIDARTVSAATNFLVVRVVRSGESSLFASGRYLDRIRYGADGDDPSFEEKLVVLDSRHIDTLLAIPI